LVSEEAAIQMIAEPAARDFIADAFAHSKFVGYVESVRPLLEAILGDEGIDEGFVEIKTARDVSKFVESCRRLRFWERGSKVKQPAAENREPGDRF